MLLSPHTCLASGQYADERLPLPDALQQLRDALAAAAALSPTVPPPLVAQADVALATPALATPQLAHERTCVVCWVGMRRARCASRRAATRSAAAAVPPRHAVTSPASGTEGQI